MTNIPMVSSVVLIPLDHDDAELQSASKQLIHLDDYETMSLMARCSYVTRDDNGNLLNFFDWEKPAG